MRERQADEVLATCPLCMRPGPKDRMEEHRRDDHPKPEHPAASGYTVATTNAVKALLERKKAETGWAVGHLVEYALQRLWGAP
jgi:hypothetical protein